MTGNALATQLFRAGNCLGCSCRVASPAAVARGAAGFTTNPETCYAAGGGTGPLSAPLAEIADALSARSLPSRLMLVAGSQPSTWPGARRRRWPTPAKASVHTTATAPTLTPCRSATGRSPGDREIAGQAVAAHNRAAAAPAAQVQPCGPLGGERPGQQTVGHRAVDDHPGAVPGALGDQARGRFPVDETER